MALALAALSPFAAAAPTSPAGDVAHLVRAAEAALAGGDVDGAHRALERAANLEHSAETELRQLRAAMQMGEYERALALAAHVAGAHLDSPAPSVLYSWLLFIGGQRDIARRLLADVSVRFPEHALVAAARDQLRSPAPLATGPLLEAPGRIAPYGKSVPFRARVVASAVLIDQGRRALAPLAAILPGSRLWVRNGLGTLTAAAIERRLPASGLLVLRLQHPLRTGTPVAIAPAAAFPGSIAHAVEYVTSADATPRWPLLSSGFIGDVDGARRALGIDLAAGPRGGPVFDAGGRLVGIAVRESGWDRLVPPSRLPADIGAMLGATDAAGRAAPVPLSRIYESALFSTLQVIVSR